MVDKDDDNNRRGVERGSDEEIIMEEPKKLMELVEIRNKQDEN